MSDTRLALEGQVTQVARPIQTRRFRTIQCALIVCPREHVVVIDSPLIRIGLMIRNAIFIREIIDDRRVGARGSLREQICLVCSQKSSQPIIPGAITNTIFRIDLVAILVGNGTEKRAPWLLTCAGHTPLSNGRTDLVRTPQSRSRTRFAKS